MKTKEKVLRKKIHSILRFFNLDFGRREYLRPMFLKIKKDFNTKLIGVEIGVLKGDNAKEILKRLDIERLYLVDPYIYYDGYYEPSWFEAYKKDLKDLENLKMKTKKKLRRDENKIEFIYKTSKEAVTLIPNNLDFVYIDGNHSYKHVMEDINLYYNKVKDRGIIGGHDFQGEEKDVIDVKNAVIDFVCKNNLQLHTIGSDWWIIKGEKRREKMVEEHKQKNKEYRKWRENLRRER